jgi:hypothetical protein
MRLTIIHARYWRERQRAPGWLQAIDAQPRAPVRTSVHECIAAHAGIPSTRHVQHYAASNLCALCRTYAARGELREALERWAQTPGTLIDAARRQGFARRWLARVRRADADRARASGRQQ